ncbi:MAG: L,D-transpeptidase family protein [Clostridia bacterium]|nr:L,D-transpeptidase family protein [Clostridia bacterium]
MRRRYAAFVVMLGTVLLMKLSLPVVAEMVTDAAISQAYKCEATSMLGSDDAIACILTKETSAAEGDTPEDAIITSSQKKTYTNGDLLVEMSLTVSGREATDEEWADIMSWIDFSIASANIDLDSLDAEQAARALLSTVTTAQNRLVSSDGQATLFDRSTLSIDSVSAWKPYYAPLARGDKNDDVAKLQQRLIDLGYLNDVADGQFGKKTADAVTAAQQELLEWEMATYAASFEAEREEVMATPAPESADGDEGNETGDTVDDVQTTATAYQPETAVDGVAGQIFLMRLYSDVFPITVPDLSTASSGLVERMQRRLIELGYLADDADGHFGSNTRRAVLLFQHYNGIEKTGVADEEFQRLAYSENAISPENPFLTSGSSGDDVLKLQNFLIRLGFMRESADGDYGPATKRAVEKVQQYLREKEIERLTEQAIAEMTRTYSAPSAQTLSGGGEQGVTTISAQITPAQPDISDIEVTPTMEVTGVADPLFLDELYSYEIDWIPQTLKNGDSNLDVERLQRRLQNLEYIFTTPDGSYGNATETAVRTFQERNNLGVDGVAGTETLRKLFSDDVKKALKPYVLEVSTSKQRVYAYAPDENEQYTVLARTMICSTGLSSTPTPKGTYQSSTGPGARWHYFKKFSCWAQYAYYIQGDIMFHSVLYGSKGGSVTSSSVRNLGSKASHGCVRLKVEDAKWIYENCPMNTKVIVY